MINSQNNSSNDNTTSGGEFSANYVTVGIGGAYLSIPKAVASGKYHLQLISDVTEIEEWQLNGHKLVLFTNGILRTVNLSKSNTSDLKIDATDINFSLLGPEMIFTPNSEIRLINCTITGNNELNKFNSNGDLILGKVDIVGRLNFNPGQKSCYLAIQDAENIHITGGAEVKSTLIIAGKVDYIFHHSLAFELNSAGIDFKEGSSINKYRSNVRSCIATKGAGVVLGNSFFTDVA